MFARLKLCSYQKKPNDVTIFIYLFLPQEISKSLFVKIRLRYRFDRHQSQCRVTIVFDLRLEVFSVLLKFILLDVIVENNPYSFMEILRYKLFCAVVRKYQPKKIEKWKFKMCLMFYLLLFYQLLNNPIWFVLYIRGIINYIYKYLAFKAKFVFRELFLLNMLA